MTLATLESAPPGGAALSPEDLEAGISRATSCLLDRRAADGHWCFELEADATIPSEYILMRRFRDEPRDPVLESKIGAYLRRTQGSHGGWALLQDGPFDISASVKAYFALKAIGDAPDAPHMARARETILASGGAARVNVFTRILLALWRQVPWTAVPAMPVEIMLLPKWFPFHLDKVSYWARTTIVPLLVLQLYRPEPRSARDLSVAELFVTPPDQIRRWPGGEHQKEPWVSLFAGIDRVLRFVDPAFPRGMRKRAVKAAEEFTLERLNGLDGLGAIFPPMVNSLLMLEVLGYPPDDPRLLTIREGIEQLLVVHDDEAYCQPCVSPVWDTALSCHALMEAGGETAVAAAREGLDWLRPRQVLDVKGDWAAQKPDVRPGGWAFQYANPHYPDLDDTAVVVMAMDRLDHATYGPAIDRAREWVEGLQSRDGGWAAFDADNAYHYLNNIPFSDHGALLDPPTEDVTARCVSMLAQLGETPATSPAMARGIDYLRKTQRDDGSWYGRWGLNYIYGTWSVLCALNAAGVPAGDPMVRRASIWLQSVQNEDGGWGESGDSYSLAYAGYEPTPSTASQSAWALLALMAAGDIDTDAVRRGMTWLMETQTPQGDWKETLYTGTGFPRVFYLRYHGYSKFFPLWAMARYRNLRAGNSTRTGFGM